MVHEVLHVPRTRSTLVLPGVNVVLADAINNLIFGGLFFAIL